MSKKEIVGLVFGICGMILCLSGLLLGISNLLFEWSNGETYLLGVPLADSIKMILLELGAGALFVSALLRGRSVKMLQTLEAAMLLFGVLFFVPMDDVSKFTFRIVISGGVITYLYRAGLLDGWLNKLAALAFDALCYGQLVNSDPAFFFGSMGLICYSLVKVRRQGGWINKLWLYLNVPYAVGAALSIYLSLHGSLGIRMLAELFIGMCLMSGFSIIAYLGLFQPWEKLEESTELINPEPTHLRCSPYYHIEGGSLSFDFIMGLTAARSRVLDLRCKKTSEQLSANEKVEYQALCEYLLKVQAMVIATHNEVYVDSPHKQIPTRDQTPYVPPQYEGLFFNFDWWIRKAPEPDGAAQIAT